MNERKRVSKIDEKIIELSENKENDEIKHIYKEPLVDKNKPPRKNSSKDKDKSKLKKKKTISKNKEVDEIKYSKPDEGPKKKFLLVDKLKIRSSEIYKEEIINQSPKSYSKNDKSKIYDKGDLNSEEDNKNKDNKHKEEKKSIKDKTKNTLKDKSKENYNADNKADDNANDEDNLDFIKNTARKTKVKKTKFVDPVIIPRSNIENIDSPDINMQVKKNENESKSMNKKNSTGISSKKTSKRLEDRDDYKEIKAKNKLMIDGMNDVLYANVDKKQEVINYIRNTGNFDTRNRSSPWYIILPNSKYKRLWDLVILINLVFCLMIIPVDVAWNIECFTDSKGENIKTLYTICSVVFFMDILIKFFTAVINEKNQYIYNLKKIAVNYLINNFLFDVLAAMPFDKFEKFSMGDCFQSYVAPSKIYLALNLVRIFKLSSYIKILEDKLSKYINIIRLVKIFLSLLYLAHLLGNIFSGNSKTAVDSVFRKCSNFRNKEEYENCLKDVLKNDFISVYCFSLSLGLILLTMNQYDNIQLNWERVYMIMINITAMGMKAAIFGNVAMIISKMSIGLPPLIQEKIDIMKEYMTFMKFEDGFIKKIEEYHINIFRKQRNMIYDSGFFGNISTSLHKLILLDQWKSTFFEVNIFISQISSSFFSNLIPLLRPKIFMFNDIIITEGDSNCTVYFISRTGLCSVKIGGEWIRNMYMGEYFGEIAIFLRSRRRTSTITSMRDSDFLSIEGDEFQKLLQDFPEDCKIIKEKVKKRLMSNIKLYPSSVFAKLVPKNDLKDYLLRKNLYLNDKEEDEIYDDKEINNTIRLDSIEKILEKLNENLNFAQKSLLKVVEYKKANN